MESNLREEINKLDEKIDANSREHHVDINKLDEKVDAGFTRVLDEKIDAGFTGAPCRKTSDANSQ